MNTTFFLKVSFLIISALAVPFGIWQAIDGVLIENLRYAVFAAIFAASYGMLGWFFYQKWFGKNTAAGEENYKKAE